MPELPSTPSLLWCLASAAALLALAAGGAWWVHLRASRAAWRRAAARRLIESVKAYGAWLECQRAERSQAPEGDAETALPEPLLRAVALKDEWFPELGPAMLRLLQSHAAMNEALWQFHLLRIQRAAPHDAVYADPHYQALRDRQDAALDALIAQCRSLVGEAPPHWRRTGTDFSFTSSHDLFSPPASRP